jgi:hypothetical protein
MSSAGAENELSGASSMTPAVRIERDGRHDSIGQAHLQGFACPTGRPVRITSIVRLVPNGRCRRVELAASVQAVNREIASAANSAPTEQGAVTFKTSPLGSGTKVIGWPYSPQ